MGSGEVTFKVGRHMGTIIPATSSCNKLRGQVPL